MYKGGENRQNGSATAFDSSKCWLFRPPQIEVSVWVFVLKVKIEYCILCSGKKGSIMSMFGQDIQEEGNVICSTRRGRVALSNNRLHTSNCDVSAYLQLLRISLLSIHHFRYNNRKVSSTHPLHLVESQRPLICTCARLESILFEIFFWLSKHFEGRPQPLPLLLFPLSKKQCQNIRFGQAFLFWLAGRLVPPPVLSFQSSLFSLLSLIFLSSPLFSLFLSFLLSLIPLSFLATSWRPGQGRTENVQTGQGAIEI